MLIDIDRGGSCNRLLQEISDSDFSLLQHHLEPATLPVRKKLESPDRSVDSVYFLDSGVVSVVTNGSADASVCVGLIGAEGATGLSVIMGSDRSPNETCVQFAGEARRIGAQDLRDAVAQSPTLQTALLSYCQTLTFQISQTALVNSWNTIEERLARWLCMAHDRGDGNELLVTHERLGEMLGVRRPAITVALAKLEDDGAISVGRGALTIIDRLLLEQKTGGMYGRAEREFERVFTPPINGAKRPPPRARAILDLAHYETQRTKSKRRLAEGEARVGRQLDLVERIEGKGQSSLSARSLLTVMQSSLVLMRKHLARIERAIELERLRER